MSIRLTARLAPLLAALTALVGAPAATAGIPFDLGEYRDAALRFDGEIYPAVPPDVNVYDDGSGTSVAGDCDVTGDGKPDAIVGAYERRLGEIEPGRVYVVPGGARAPGAYSMPDAAGAASANAIVIEGDPTIARHAGEAVACAGDVNGDGADDVLLGAYLGSPSTHRGAWVVFGGPALVAAGTVQVTELPAEGGADGFHIRGGGGYVGRFVAGVGDLDGDGKDEVAVGSDTAVSGAGNVYVVAGRTGTAEVDLAVADSTLLKVTGAVALDALGRVAPAGDVDGDGVGDIVVGAPSHSGPNGAKAGAASVIDGNARGTVGLAVEDASVLLAIHGGAPDRRAGWRVAGVGDLDGDGLDDVAVTDGGVQTAGDTVFRSMAVVHGSETAKTVDLAALGADGLEIDGAPSNQMDDHFGDAIAPAGDVDGDGLDDMLIGAKHFYPPGEAAAGAAYLLYGSEQRSDVAIADLTCEQGARLVGVNPHTVGASVSRAGDFDGSGRPQLLIGAPGDNHVLVLPISDVEDACEEDEEPEPPAPTYAEVDWGFRENFRRYVSNGFNPANPATPIAASAGAFCDANPDTVKGGCDPKVRLTGDLSPPATRVLRWTPVGAGKTDGSDTTIAAQGRVTFRFPTHFFTFKLEDPWFVVAGGQVTVRARMDLDVDPSFTGYKSADVRLDVGTFPLAGAATVTSEHVVWKTGEGVLSTVANDALGNFLGAGAVLDPIAITIPHSLGELPEEPKVPVAVEPPGGGGGSDTPKDPGGGPKPPADDPAPAKRPRWSVPAGKLEVTGAGPVAVATLACGSGTCKVAAPRTTVLKVGRKRFAVRVLAPLRIAGGKRGKVRVQLTEAAREALAGRTGKTGFKVTVRENGRKSTRTIVARFTAKQGKTASAKGR